MSNERWGTEEEQGKSTGREASVEFRGTAVGRVWTGVEEKVKELEKERMRNIIKESQKDGFFNKRCGISDVLDFGKHAGDTFVEVYFCDPGCCGWALSQQPKMDTLEDFKYFLERAGDIEHEDKREKEKRERERDSVTASLRKVIQDRASKCAEELAQEDVRVAEETEEREKAAKRVGMRDEEDGAARNGESHRSKGGEEKKKTDWMELLEVARVKDTGATEEKRRR